MSLETLEFKPPEYLGEPKLKGYRVQDTPIEILLYENGPEHWLQIKTSTRLTYDAAVDIFRYIVEQERPQEETPPPAAARTRKFVKGPIPHVYISPSEEEGDVALLNFPDRYFSWWSNPQGETPFFDMITTRIFPHYLSDVMRRASKDDIPFDLTPDFVQARHELMHTQDI